MQFADKKEPKRDDVVGYLQGACLASMLCIATLSLNKEGICLLQVIFIALNLQLSPLL